MLNSICAKLDKWFWLPRWFVPATIRALAPHPDWETGGCSHNSYQIATSLQCVCRLLEDLPALRLTVAAAV